MKTFKSIKKVGNRTIMVVGEMTKKRTSNKMSANPPALKLDNNTFLISEIVKVQNTKYFVMGWAICDENDQFDEQIGTKICMKRFDKNQQLSTSNPTMLTSDMCQSLVDNEVKFIENNLDKYINFFKS